MPRRSITALAVAACAALAQPAHAQCDGRWIYGPDQIVPPYWGIEDYPLPSMPYQPVHATLAWDPDGDGPLKQQLIIGGSFDNDGSAAFLHRIARWNGATNRWEQLSADFDGPNNVVYALTAWNVHVDAAGPTELIAAGQFSGSGAMTFTNIARWSSGQWRPMPGAALAGGSIRALTTWDPDGDGPLPPDLIAAGNFLTAGGTTVNRIARHNGVDWLPLGAGLDNEVRALASWDPDGPGPLTPRLAAAGTFLNASGQPAKRVAVWDGAQWSPLGSGIDGLVSGDIGVNALVSWDIDGDGPITPRLVATGQFATAGGAAASRIASWDGAQWSALGAGLGRYAAGSIPFALGYGLTTHDGDGPGPAPREVVVVGRFHTAGGLEAINVAAWNGSQWRDVDQYLGHETSSRFTHPHCISTFDPDGTGPRGEMLFAGGDFFFAGAPVTSEATLIARHVALSDGKLWQPFVTGIDEPVLALANWDPDGAGPAPGQMVMAGQLRIAGRQRAKHIIAWDGADWTPFASGLVGTAVNAVHVWDPDGPGPLSEQLLAGHHQGQSSISRWNGSQWNAFGDPAWGSTVVSITDWDPDGPGPLAPRIIVVRQNNSVVRAWNGSAWSVLGTFDSIVRAVTTWDPDGPGPANALLIAVGNFTKLSSGSTTLNRVAAWNGAEWLPVGSGVNAIVHTVCSWDSDGAGPLPPSLAIGGDFVTPIHRVGYFHASQWLQMNGGLGGAVRTLATWDPDGPGPTTPELLAGGDFTTDGLGATILNHIARWDGAAWQPLGTGANASVRAIAPYLPDGPGSVPVELIIGGEFNTVGDQASCVWARWSATGKPWVASDPQARSIAADQTVSFTAGAAPGYDFAGPLSFQWRRNGAPITDGPSGASPNGGTIDGSQSAELTISGAQPSDAGHYDCVISNGCGSAATNTALLTIIGGVCPADLNGDGVIDFGDYLEFLNLFDALDPRADFNMDGIVDFADYLEFLNHFDAGC